MDPGRTQREPPRQASGKTGVGEGPTTALSLQSSSTRPGLLCAGPSIRPGQQVLGLLPPTWGLCPLLGVLPADLRQGLQGKQFIWEVTPDGAHRGAGLSQGMAGSQPGCLGDHANQLPQETGGGMAEGPSRGQGCGLLVHHLHLHWLRTLLATVAPGRGLSLSV